MRSIVSPTEVASRALPRLETPAMNRTFPPIALAIFLATVSTLAGCTTSDEPTSGRGYAVTSCDPASGCADGAVCREDLCLAACAADADCPAGAVCAEGVCFSSRGAACAADSDCPAESVCAAGACAALPPVLACAADADCPAGSACDASGACAATPPECVAAAEVCNGVDDDCDGLVDEGADSACDDADPSTADACTAGACTHGSDPTEWCGAVGVVCAPGSTCMAGVCVGTPACVAEACGNGIDDDCDGLVDEECAAAACAADSDCDDGDPATRDACVAGVCTHG